MRIQPFFYNHTKSSFKTKLRNTIGSEKEEFQIRSLELIGKDNCIYNLLNRDDDDDDDDAEVEGDDDDPWSRRRKKKK